MVDLQSHLSAIRAIMEEFPPLESHAPQTPIDLAEMYYPKSHAAALDPERALVVGNRGMGKSFWASALVNPGARNRISLALPEARLGKSQLDVQFGFAEAEGAVQVSRDELALFIAREHPVEQIWRAVTLPAIARHAGREVPSRLSERLSWVAEEPGEVRELLRDADHKLTISQSKLLFIFDQLEQLSDDLDVRADLTKGILRLALAFKSYRNLRVKVFMRPDHYAEDRLFSFPDASKVRGEAVQLDWRSFDLYGLMFSRLFRSSPQNFRAIAEMAGCHLVSGDTLTLELLQDEVKQHRVFDIVAGDAMGTRKQGLPYTWLISHLADARNQVSPRTFMRAVKFAAENAPPPTDKSIDHFGIHEGVRRASENRVDDLKEDYPWIPPVLDALRGLLVPCLPEEIFTRWSVADDLMTRLTDLPPAKRPVWLSSLVNSDQEMFSPLLKSLADIGVMEIRTTTGKIDVPDIFRLPAGIKRKGGITQQQRRKGRI